MDKMRDFGVDLGKDSRDFTKSRDSKKSKNAFSKTADLKDSNHAKRADSMDSKYSKDSKDSKRAIITNCKTLIIKIGSSILASQNLRNDSSQNPSYDLSSNFNQNATQNPNQNPSKDSTKSPSFPNKDFIASLACQIATLKAQIPNIIIVSSGAVACGFRQLGLKSRPKDIIDKQASAAIGQARLMWEYQQAFSKQNLQVAQILLTKDDLTSRKRFTHAHSCIMRLLHFGIIPIINENDTILVDELKYIETFGDNDNLASLVAGTIDADLLLILSDVDGLYSANPATNPHAQKIDEVEDINEKILALAKSDTDSGEVGTGGMASKLLATRQALSMGCAVAIIKGNENQVILRFFGGENLGTFFALPKEILARKKKRFWIESVAITQGKIFIDMGAFGALKRKKSLLAKGILGVAGEFGSGEVVSICIKNGEACEIARGQSRYSAQEIAKIAQKDSKEIAKILGKSNGDEVVHIDEIVLLQPH